MNKFFKTLLKIIVVAILIFAMLELKIIDFKELPNILNYQVLLVLLIIFLTLPIANYGWWLLLKDAGYNISFISSFQIYTTGVFFNIFMPGGSGGDIVKCVYLYQYTEKNQRSSSILTVIISRIIGLHALLFLTMFLSIFLFDKALTNQAIFNLFFLIYSIFFLILLLIFLLYFFKDLIFHGISSLRTKKFFRAKEIVLNILKIIYTYKNKKLTLLKCWIISVINHTLFLSTFYFMSLILDLNVLNFFESIIVGGLSMISNTIPITPGGLGIGESVYNYFTILFLDNATYEVLTFGTIFFITFRLLFTFVALICGISFIMLGKPPKKYTLSNYSEH